MMSNNNNSADRILEKIINVIKVIIFTNIVIMVISQIIKAFN
jgi:hypothetical protein